MVLTNVFRGYDRPITDFLRDSPSPPLSERSLPNDRLIRHPRLRRSPSDRRVDHLPRPRQRPICLDERRDNRRREVKDEIIKRRQEASIRNVKRQRQEAASRSTDFQRQFAAVTMGEQGRRGVKEERQPMMVTGEERDKYERALSEVNRKITLQNLKKMRKEKMRSIPKTVHEKALNQTRSAIRNGIISSHLSSPSDVYHPPPPPTHHHVKVEMHSSDANHPPTPPPPPPPSSDVNHPPPPTPPPTHFQPNDNDNVNNGSNNDSDNSSSNNNPSPDDVNRLPSTGGLEKAGKIANILNEKELPTYVNAFRGKTPPSIPSDNTSQFRATKSATSCYHHMKNFHSWFSKCINNMKKEQMSIDQIRLSEVALELGTEIGDPANRALSSQVQALIHQNLPSPPSSPPRNGLPNDFIPIDFIAFGSLLHDLCRKYDTILAICPTAAHASLFEVFDFLAN